MARAALKKVLAATLVPLVLLLALEGCARVFTPAAETVEVAGARGARIPTWVAQDAALRETLGELDRLPKEIDVEAVFRFWEFYRRDRELHYRLKPGLDAPTVNTLSPPPLIDKMHWRVTSNADGFRGRTLEEAPEGAELVVCLGDSSTYGWGVEEKEAWPARLEGYLAEDGRWAVVNLGHPGFTSFQGRVLLPRVAARRPAHVVISFGTNDASLAGLGDAELHRRDHSLPARAAALAEHLALYRGLQRVMLSFWKPGAGGTGRLVPRVGVAEYAANLRALVAGVREAGGRPVLLLIGRPRGYAEAMARVAAETATPFVAAQSILDAALPELRSGAARAHEVAAVRARLGAFLDDHPEYLLLVDSTHPNALGHDLIARRLTGVIAGRSPR